MITKANYYEKVNEIGLKNLPKVIQEMHELISHKDGTKNGSDWSIYDNDAEFREYCQAQFKALEKQLEKLKPADKKVFIVTPPKYEFKQPEKASAEKKLTPERAQKAHENTASKKQASAEKVPAEKKLKKRKPKFKVGDKIMWHDSDNTPVIEEILEIVNVPPDLIRYKTKSNNKGYGNQSYDEGQLVKFIAERIMAINKFPPKFGEVIPKEIMFIRKYLRLNGNTVSKSDIIKFIKSLQSAITKREIRKTSDWAAEIMQIQNNLVKAHNKMVDDKASDIRIIIAPETVESLQVIANSVAIERHVVLIKRFLSWLSNTDKDKARKLLADIKKEKFSGTIADEMSEIVSALENFLSDQPMKLSEMTLTGLCELCGINGLGFVPGILQTAAGLLVGNAAQRIINGKKADPKPAEDPVEKTVDDAKVVNSGELKNAEFETLPFTGKWHDLVGAPCPGFTCLIYGAPKLGKSTLAIDFAKYLAENFGKTLYVAAEEGIGEQLSDKIKRLGAEHPRLFFADKLPADIGKYGFVFIDSINRAKLDYDALLQLKADYPKTSFFYVSQVTKDGSYRGSRELEHDVDCVIEVDRIGHARGYGRFAQGGEAEIYYGD